MRVGVAVDMHLRQIGPLYRKKTVTNRRYYLDRFVDHTGNMALRAVRPKHVHEWLSAQTCGPASLRVALSNLRVFFRWCVEHGHLKADPTFNVKSPKSPRALPRGLCLDDLRQLGETIPDARGRLAVGLMLDMGLRVGEVAGLEIGDIDLRAGVVRVVGKGGHQRDLPLTPTVRQLLTEYLPERGLAGGPLIRSFTNPAAGVTPKHLSILVSGWMRDAGFHQAGDGRTAHSLRHSMAQNLYRHGTDLRDIQAALGHASASTTWIYLRAEAAVENLRAVMGQQFIDEPVPKLAPVADFQVPSIVQDIA